MLLLIAVQTFLLVQYVHGAVHVHDGVPVRSIPGVLQVEICMSDSQQYSLNHCLINNDL